MRSGFGIGRIFGIDIRIDWSWLLIFFLITWNLSIGFGQIHTNWSVALIWGLAVLASLLFFASVLAHEMAHSLVARAQGVPVRNITLFLFGGVSNIQREPPSPRAEFLITIVGPITSIIIGVVLLGLVSISLGQIETINQPAAVLSELGPTTTMLIWLGTVNLILGFFNLIPGFPLDGGRILRSILWASTGSLRKATRWASGVGQTVAWLLILGGIAMIFGFEIPVFGGGFVNGLWLIFIGWFLNSAAVQSYRRVVIQDLLSDVPVSRIMRPNPPTVPADISVHTLIDDHVMRMDDHAFPVVENNQLVGIVTLDDIRTVTRDRWNTTTVSQIMTGMDDLTLVQPQDEADDAMMELMKRDVRQLPVVSDGRTLVGVLRRRDIMKWLQLQSDLDI